MATEKRAQITQDLIKAAIDSISERGISGATVRDIAGRASVNTAAVNYYFGSRDALIETAMHVSLENAFDIHEFDFDNKTDYRDILRTYLNHWKAGMINYPGLTRAHFDAILNQSENAPMVTEGFNRFIDGIFALMVVHGMEDRAENSQKIKIIFGSFISSMLFPDICRPAANDSTFVDVLVSQL